MNKEPYICYKNLRRDPKKVFGKLYQDPNFTNCIHNIEEIVKKKLLTL